MLKYIERKDVPCGTPKRNLRNDIREFINSGRDAAEITGIDHYVTPGSACGAYRMAIRRMGLQNEIVCILRSGRVFLLRTSLGTE